MEMKKYAARVPALELPWQPPTQTLTSSTDSVHKAVLAATSWHSYWWSTTGCLSVRPTHLFPAYRPVIKTPTELRLWGTPICHKIQGMCVLQKTLLLCTRNLLQSAANSWTFIDKPCHPIQSSNFIFITRYSIFTLNVVPADRSVAMVWPLS